MAATDTTKLIIELQTILRGLNQTLRGLDQIKKKLGEITQPSGSSKGLANLQRQLNQQQRAVEALQRQRSAALIAEENKRLRAVEALQRQRGAAILAEQKRQATAATVLQRQRSAALLNQERQRLATVQALERRNQTAAESLQRQRSASLIAAQKQRDAFEDRAARARLATRRSEERQALRASESLQRQRSAALIKQARDEERARPQFDAHVQAFRKAEAAAQAFNQRLAGVGNSLRSIGQGLSTVGATLSATVTAPLVALGIASVNAAVQLDSLKRGLTAIVGSSTEANRQLERLTQIAKLPGIGFQEAIQGSIRLQAVGFSALEAESALRQFSNAIALTGGGRDELARVTVQLGQLAAKGKVLSQDLRPIIEAAPAVGRALLQAFGTVNADDIQELGLSSKQFLSVLVDQLGELPRAAAGAKNSFENFRDELFRAAATVGDALLPALTRLVEVIGPVITSLANAFGKLPTSLQVVAIGFVGLVAALGPVLFVTGQLTTGVGRLLVGFAQLNAIGILPTIRNLRAMVAGTLSAAQAQRTLAASTALVTGALGAVVAILAIAVTAYAAYSAFQKDSVQVAREQSDVLRDQINGLEQQIKFLDGLKTGVERTGDEQERLLEIYNQLNTTAKARIVGITDEEERLAALREELQRVIKLRRDEQFAQSATIASKIASNAAAIESEDRLIERLQAGVQIRTRLIEAIQESNKLDKDQREQVKRLTGEFGGLVTETSDVRTAIEALQFSNRGLVKEIDSLRDGSKEARSELRDQIPILKQLASEDKENIRALLTFAKTMGTFRGDVDKTTDILIEYIKRTKEATGATKDFRDSMSGATTDLLRSGKDADEQAKRRKEIISAAAANAREASDSFEGALKFLRAFIAAQPELRAALEREARIQGKSFDELVQKSLESAFGRTGQDKVGTSLRSAQEELAKALAAVALASSEEQVRIRKEEADKLLRQAEVSQQLQIISYREFLETRAQLTKNSIEAEIVQQGEIVAAAKNTQARLLAAASVAGIPTAERTKRQAQAARASEEAIKAEAKLSDLAVKREQIEIELQQTLRVAQREQIENTRQLDIEFAELQGHIQDALDAQVVDDFRERLVDLGLAQASINKQLDEARKKRDADRISQLATAQRLNQSQIDVIELIVQQREALSALAAAEELVRQARLKQQQLEEDLAFQVEFRGLKEEDAIARRLAGEEKLNASLANAHETIRQIVADLQLRGVEPPRALLEFLGELQSAVKGLAELPFSEQFRLAQKEFDRLNDERLQKIADVERAVRQRSIAEIEGLLIIRRINGQYSADLEQQLALLKQIAAQSNDANLIHQAQSAQEVVADANEELVDLDRQLRSTSIDALQEGFTNFFTSLRDRTKDAKEKLLDLVDSVAVRIEQVIAENLSKQLIESLFGDGTEGQGIVASIGRLFGFGGGAGSAGGAGAAVASGVTQASQATVAATAITAAGTTLATTVITSATAFASTIIAAGAAFAATVTASGVSQGIGGLGSAIGAATGIFPAVQGGVVRIVEGGYPEAVLTTDPKHAARQVAILRAFLKETRGLGGRIRGLAAGGFTDRIDIAAPNVSVSNAGIGELAVAGAPSMIRLRQVLVDERSMGNWINSSEGEQVVVDFLYKHAPVIRKIGGK